MMVIVEIDHLAVHLPWRLHIGTDFLHILLILTVKSQCRHAFRSRLIGNVVDSLHDLPISLFPDLLPSLFYLNFLLVLFRGELLLHWLSQNCRLGFFLDFLNNRLLGVLSLDNLLQFCNLVQFLGAKI